MVGKKRYLQLFFYPDWRPVSNRDSSRAIVMERKGLDHVSFGTM
jgi:cellobiose epimerase